MKAELVPSEVGAFYQYNQPIGRPIGRYYFLWVFRFLQIYRPPTLVGGGGIGG